MDVYGFGIDFYQIWYVFNLLKQIFGAIVHGFKLFFLLSIWNLSGYKINFRELVFKGLIQINILGVLDAFQFNAL